MATIPQPPSDNLWTEPESARNTETEPVYPYNNQTLTESGHSFEMDDTPTRERIRLQHREGTFIEMHPNGDEVHKVYGTGYEIHLNGKNVLIKGTCNISIEGNANMEVKGDYNLQVAGDYNVLVGGKMKTRSVDNINLSSDKKVAISANENFGGSISLAAADHIFVDSDLRVAGAAVADLITSQTRVDAATGVHAGFQGVYSVGPITSLISVQAPLGTFVIMDAVLMSDVINSSIYNMHIHFAPRGTTSPPLSNFLGI